MGPNLDPLEHPKKGSIGPVSGSIFPFVTYIHGEYVTITYYYLVHYTTTKFDSRTTSRRNGKKGEMNWLEGKFRSNCEMNVEDHKHVSIHAYRTI